MTEVAAASANRILSFIEMQFKKSLYEPALDSIDYYRRRSVTHCSDAEARDRADTHRRQQPSSTSNSTAIEAVRHIDDAASNVTQSRVSNATPARCPRHEGGGSWPFHRRVRLQGFHLCTTSAVQLPNGATSTESGSRFRHSNTGYRAGEGHCRLMSIVSRCSCAEKLMRTLIICARTVSAAIYRRRSAHFRGHSVRGSL